jgi:linoleoyl-CoA desaturase
MTRAARHGDDEATAIRQFRRRLRTESNAYFHTRRRGADWRGWTKLVVGLALHGGTMAAIIAVPMPVAAAQALWIVNGLAQAFLLANVGHDAVHQAFAGNRRADAWLAHVMSLCGVDPGVYRTSHVREHHGVVNVGLVDAALDARGLLRVSPHRRPRCSAHGRRGSPGRSTRWH